MLCALLFLVNERQSVWQVSTLILANQGAGSKRTVICIIYDIFDNVRQIGPTRKVKLRQSANCDIVSRMCECAVLK